MHYGFDIGGTKIELVCFDDEEIVFKQRVPTPKDSYSAFLDALSYLVNQADAQFDRSRTIGIGMCGVIEKKSGRLLSANLPALTGKSLQKDISEQLNTQVNLENDCKCFAYSEANGGAADGYDTVLGVILGTGLGGGLCINGQLLHGANGIVGELGHGQLGAALAEKHQLPVQTCGCGNSACIEQFISGTGLENLYRLKGGDAQKAHEIIALMREGEDRALMVFDIFIDILAGSLATIIHVVDPDAIVFGGGLSNVDEIYQKLPKALERHLLSVVPAPKLLKPKFGDSSGVRGAALLAKHRSQN